MATERSPGAKLRHCGRASPGVHVLAGALHAEGVPGVKRQRVAAGDQGRAAAVGAHVFEVRKDLELATGSTVIKCTPLSACAQRYAR